MKNILLIATGGTIASSESAEGLTPSIDVNKLLSYIPEIKSICHLDGISIMNVDSTNMNPSLMARIAQAVADNYNQYDGFVITHGTDTCGYSAAALSYMMTNLNKPVILTGSQIPIEALYTDAKKNLSDAIRFACDGINGVYVCFDGSLICGTHAMKVKTRSSDAFKSINFPVVAQIKLGKITHNQMLTLSGHWDTLTGTVNGDFAADTALCTDIIVLKIFPGIGTEIFDFIKDHYRGVVIESFGIGGIPGANNNIVEKIHELITAGISVVITTQCLYEGIDLSIYEVGQHLAKQNIITAADMTTEAVTMKLMWALAHFDSQTDIKEFMEHPVFCDRSY